MDWDCIHFSPIRERQYRIEKEGDKVTVWDDARGVGLRFIEGDTLQRYTSELILKDTEEWEEVDADTLTAISNTLTDYAAERYPKEFEPIKTE